MSGWISATNSDCHTRGSTKPWRSDVFSGGPGRGELGPFWDLHKNCGFRKVSTIIPVGHESLPERLASEHHALMSSTLQWIAFVAQGCFFPSNIGALGGFR